ncbi:hypothetical protein LVJ82_09415 [Vitreoscilla massiliensis]|uniref:Uncharacterized protein n=1 Tax=Vitreoscilla massiliensis TaxID=1689272 RepID=A0ABY4E8C6_9NEIS|nr:hypothetical protein [Vitreoscilla massiliensis]UOO91155.1 hypothetical protein LVJ82_09415 [Vitreoscilla massiliensis]
MITAEDIIRLMVIGYWGAMLLLMLIVWLLVWKLVPKGHKWWASLLGTAAAAALFVSPMFKQNAKAQEKNQALQIRKEKYLAAKAVFDERCKNAGFKVYRTVENVEGVTLLNVWPDEKQYENQMWEYAGLPKAFGGEEYFQGFLAWRVWDLTSNHFKNQGFVSSRPIVFKEKHMGRYKNINGYQFVDLFKNNEYYRYQPTDLFDIPNSINDIPSKVVTKPSRYTIGFENPISVTDRNLWIATTKAIIKDSQTGELLAEAEWHTFHGAQGKIIYSGTGIWDRASMCPRDAIAQFYPIQSFALSVLKPKQLPPQLQPKAAETTDVEALTPNIRFNQRN